ncbi:MAG: hypothetical protein ACTSW1_11835 [Candidatus Hodarchaeales archaeon]
MKLIDSFAFLIVSILLITSLTPALANTEPVNVVQTTKEGLMISVQLDEYDISTRNSIDALVIFLVVVNEKSSPANILASVILLETPNYEYYYFSLIGNPYFSQTWLLGYEGEQFGRQNFQFDFFFMQYPSLIVGNEFRVYAAIFSEIIPKVQQNDFSQVLMEYQSELQNFIPSSTVVTSNTTTPESTSSILSLPTPSFTLFVSVVTLVFLMVVKSKKERNL